MRKAIDITASPTQYGEYQLYPLKTRHLAEFEEWARARLLEQARKLRRSMAGDTPQEQQAFWQAALAESREIKIDNLQGLTELMSLAGTYWQLWMSLRQGDEYRTLTYEQTYDLAPNIAEAHEMADAIRELSGWNTVQQEDDETTNPTPPAS